MDRTEGTDQELGQIIITLLDSITVRRPGREEHLRNTPHPTLLQANTAGSLITISSPRRTTRRKDTRSAKIFLLLLLVMHLRRTTAPLITKTIWEEITRITKELLRELRGTGPDPISLTEIVLAMTLFPNTAEADLKIRT